MTVTGSLSISQRIRKSFTEALGSIIFGMEDGTVSIFGLVFGVAASAATSQAVLLAGAVGAISAAVSMMAGTYLDVATERDRAQAALAAEQREIEQNPEAEIQEIRDRLLHAGFAAPDTETILSIVQRTPNALLTAERAFELHLSPAASQNPWVQALWMFVADLFAAFIPVIPFGFFSLASARIVSLMVTALLLLLLGVGRGIIGQKPILRTALQTLGIAAAAGLAGLIVGSLITG